MAIIDVIKYNGGPDVLAWKYPCEELGTWTQLIVNESQEAIFVKSGQVFDVFEAGRHTLDTANIPLLSKIVNLPFGGNSPFTAEVWYINKAFNLDIKWGTPTPIQIQDPKFGIFVPISSNGAFGIQIAKSVEFFIKIVGTLKFFDKASVTKYFRSLYITKVKDSISSYLVRKGISVLEINAYLDELSQYVCERMQPVMDEYGIRLTNFYINEICVPDDDSSVIKLKDALSKRAEMNIIGYSYQQERSFNTLDDAVKKTGTSANLMEAGMGLSMGVGIGRSIGRGLGEMTQELQTSAQNTTTAECPKCHKNIPAGQRFCGSCGYDINTELVPDKKKKICSSCGEMFIDNAKFCSSCGRKLSLCPECGNDIPDGSEKCPSCGCIIPIICPECGAMVPADSKFCSECGHSFARTCPKCGAMLKGTPKFCSECGHCF